MFRILLWSTLFLNGSRSVMQREFGGLAELSPLPTPRRGDNLKHRKDRRAVLTGRFGSAGRGASARHPSTVEREDKLVDVVGLYLNPPDKAVVLCVDEKSQVQTLDRTQPSLPMKPGRARTMTHDYKRHCDDDSSLVAASW